MLNVTLMRRHRLWRDSVLGNGRVPGAVLAGVQRVSVWVCASVSLCGWGGGLLSQCFFSISWHAAMAY